MVIKKIDENFDDEEYFESLKTVLFSYKPIVLFMDCLKQKHSSFNFYLNYIEYLVNPMSYDLSFYPNIISPFISIKIYDSNGNEKLDNKKFFVLDETKEKFSEHNIKECAKDICLLVDNINKTNYQACVKKYSKPEQENVAMIIMNN